MLTSSKPVKWTFALAVLVLLGLNFMFAQLTHWSSVLDLTRRHPARVEHQLPDADLLRAVFLNFETLSADLAWIWSVVYWGRQKAQNNPPKYLRENAHIIADLDPQFYPIYTWFDTTYLRSRHSPSHQEVETVNAFLERGMEQFPTEYRLPYMAGMNYIGHAPYRSDKQYVKELSKGIDYLKRASRLSGAPSNLPLTVSWMYQRRRQLRSELPGADVAPSSGSVGRRQVEFLAEMYYQLDDGRARRKIRRTLVNTPYGRKLLSKNRRHYNRTLNRKRHAEYAYLQLVLWSLLTTDSS
ncbi:MAG: hypothetical protein ABEK29_00265 [Bradymonadaceae bacterium]